MGRRKEVHNYAIVGYLGCYYDWIVHSTVNAARIIDDNDAWDYQLCVMCDSFVLTWGDGDWLALVVNWRIYTVRFKVIGGRNLESQDSQCGSQTYIG